jgi:hypothetical protein
MSSWQIPPRESPETYNARLRDLIPEAGDVTGDQHVVSRVLLKGFAAPGLRGSGWQLAPYDVRRGHEQKLRGLKGCGKVVNFLPYASTSAERLWNEVETRLDAAISAARDGRLHEREKDVGAIKDGIALHLVRSLRYREAHRAAVHRAVADLRTNMLQERTLLLLAEFYRRYGLYPAGLDALNSVLDGPISKWLDTEASGALPRVSMEFMFQRVRDTLRPDAVEIWHVPIGRELLISDAPAITFRYSNDGALMELHVAIGDSHGTALPLARDCLAVIGPAAKDALLAPEQVDWWNRIQVRSAYEHVYYRPGSGLGSFVAAARSGLPPDIPGRGL